VADPQVLCLGEVLFDKLADQAGKPLEQVLSWTDYPGGAPANVACALAKLGTPSAFLGCVGVDAIGNTLVELLQSCGVDERGIQRHPTAPTREVFVVRSEAGDRQFSGFGDRPTDAFADAFLQADQLPIDLFANARILVLGTLELAYADSAAAVRHALTLTQHHPLQVFMDVNWRPMFWQDPAPARDLILELLPQVNLLKLSAEEADWLFETRDPQAIITQFDALAGVLITDGDRGCTYAVGGYADHVGAFSVDVEDTTGAGDAFVAGFIHQLCQPEATLFKSAEAMRDAVVYASAVGALTTMRAGAIAAQPTVREVEAFLYLNPAPSPSDEAVG